MMKRIPALVLGALLLFGGCASQPTRIAEPAPKQAEPAPPPKPPPPPEPVPQLPLREELVRSEPAAKPEWVRQGTHPDDNETLYFVGYSGKHIEERDASNEARFSRTLSLDRPDEHPEISGFGRGRHGLQPRRIRGGVEKLPQHDRAQSGSPGGSHGGKLMSDCQKISLQTL